MVGPARGDLARTTPAIGSHELFGCDPTTAIVSVEADIAGRARIWRRVGGRVDVTERRFPNWFLTTDLDLLAHLPATRLSADWLRECHGDVQISDWLTVVELDSQFGAADLDAYRYLVLTTKLDEVETALVETANKRDGGDALTLDDLRGLVLIWPPTEQFLTLTGRTYFKGLSFEDLHRFQFDLETTGLNEDRDRIFMISMRDSTGWRECLDTTSLTEAQLIEKFVEFVKARDPDTLENHNIFGFDLPFIVKRANRLGVRLSIGRDASEPWLETDAFDAGERSEPFLRWRVAGREVIDTQHAVRRYGIDAPDMRRHGLKDAARYFGFASSDREYVPGAEIWSTYQTDPARVRRYAEADVDEVDGLSRRLLPSTFGLTTMLPRPYERLAADSGPVSLWELLLVRGYLHEGRAIVAPTPREERPSLGSRSELFIRGVVGRSVRAFVQQLMPSIVADQSTGAANDGLQLLPRMVTSLMARDAEPGATVLAGAAYPYLARQGLFSDPAAADEVNAGARQYIDQLVRDLRARGCLVLGVDGEQVLFGVPPSWSDAVEQEVARAARAFLPRRVVLTYPGQYEALYVRAAGNSITLGLDGLVTLAGPAFRAGRLERFGEAFMQRAAPCALRGEAVELRRLFLDTVHMVRTGQVPLEDLSVQVTLHKSPAQYRRGETHEEPYEVLLAAGIRAWRVGQRIRYFRARGGESRLLQDGDATSSMSSVDADSEYYVQRLSGLYCQQFAQAFRRDDFARIFRLPAGPGPYEDDAEFSASLAAIRPIAEPVVESIG